MDRLIFFCAFGREYLEQFDLVYPDLIGWGDILLVTDSDIERAGVNVIKLPGRERQAAAPPAPKWCYRLQELASAAPR